MTDGDKETEIAARITRLSEIRADLVVARSNVQEGLRRLVAGAREAGGCSESRDGLQWRPEGMRHRNVEPWPTREQLDEDGAKIQRLKEEADVLLNELAGLGVDSALFKLNGD